MNNLESIFGFLSERPLVQLAAMIIPLLAVARWLRRFPTPRLLIWFSVPVLASLGTIWVPAAIGWALVLDVVWVVLAMIDLGRTPGWQRFRAERELVRIASLGKPHPVSIAMTYQGRRSCDVRIVDDVPDGASTRPPFFPYRFRKLSRASFDYTMSCVERGKFWMKAVFVQVQSPWRLWRGVYEIPVRDQLYVFPDLKQVAEFELLARTNRLNLLGFRRSRHIGQDNEFERLRDYNQDDNYRFIDWRATARRRKLTVRDFQTNQSQRIIFMLDCGRMLTGESAGKRVFDQALNAMLMLSYVALRQGDSAGLICFSDEIHNFVPARSGTNHLNRLLHATFAQQARFVESRYDEAFLYLQKHCSKRSLVVLITNVIDEINALQIQQFMGIMSRRHLPLAVMLKDHDLFDVIDHPETADHGIYTSAAAARIASWRHQVLVDLKHRGVLALDVFPENLTAELVNQYLEIKAKHLL